jgi:hypothetical protein
MCVISIRVTQYSRIYCGVGFNGVTYTWIVDEMGQYNWSPCMHKSH